MSFIATDFMGRQATANKNLSLHVLGTTGDSFNVKKGDTIGTIWSWLNDPPNSSNLYFDIVTPKGHVIVAPKDIVGTELEKEVKKEKDEEAEKKRKENETLTDKIGSGLFKIVLIGMSLAAIAYVLGKKLTA